MKNKLYTILLLTLIIGIKQTHAQFYNQGAEVTIQSGAVVTVEGNFRNDAGSNFKNSGTIEIKQQLTNDQPMTDHFGGLWRLNGTGTQKISGAEPFWMYVMELNNAGGFLLQNSVIINKQVDFAAGIVDASAPTNVLIFQKNAQQGSPAAADASHITGAVIKEGDTQTFTYPVGDGTKYQPIMVNLIANENGLLGKYIVGDAGPALGFGTGGTDPALLYTYNSKEYWDLTPINNGATKADVTVYWDSYNDGLGDAANYRKVAHLDGGSNKWLNEGTSGVGTIAAGSVISNTVSTWSPFTVGAVQAVALPVRLISFTGKKLNENNVLSWVTSEEKNASHFEIERSVNVKTFEKIGQVIANKSENYNFIDYSSHIVNSSSLFYRLKIVDTDGKYNYSKIINIANDSENETISQFYPNPSIENFATVDIVAKEKGDWNISHFDLAGRLLKTENKIFEKGLNRFTVHNLPKGESIFQFQNSDKLVTRKVIR
jgi:hypothetical protein